MAQASKSVLTNFGAFAGASILALGLVAAPPDPHGVRTESRAVQLTAATWPGATYLQALEDFVSQRAQRCSTVASVRPRAEQSQQRCPACSSAPTAVSSPYQRLPRLTKVGLDAFFPIRYICAERSIRNRGR